MKENEMDFIHITHNSNVISGLSDMLKYMIGPHDLVHHYVDIPMALFIIEIAKISEDKPEWFPHGKWATIQAIEEKIDNEIEKIRIASTNK